MPGVDTGGGGVQAGRERACVCPVSGMRGELLSYFIQHCEDLCLHLSAWTATLPWEVI